MRHSEALPVSTCCRSAQAVGAELDLSDKGLGIRSRRYALLADDGVVRTCMPQCTAPVSMPCMLRLLERLQMHRPPVLVATRAVTCTADWCRLRCHDVKCAGEGSEHGGGRRLHSQQRGGDPGRPQQVTGCSWQWRTPGGKK